MRRMLAIMACFGLAACDAAQLPVPAGWTADRLAGREIVGGPERIAVVTRKSVPDYVKDLAHCRAVAAAALGPPGVDDDLDALRRALKDHPNDRIVSPAYINSDLKIRRREAIKRCLLDTGYLVIR